MRRPRIRIAWVMAATAIAALDLGALRAVVDHRGPLSGMFAMGALPMANVLAFGLLWGWLRRGSRPYLVGFEALGALALGFYITAILAPSHRESVPQAIVFGYLRLAWDVWPRGSTRTLPRVVLAYSALSLWVTWPQLALAIAGGFWARYPLRDRSVASGVEIVGSSLVRAARPGTMAGRATGD